MEKIGTKKPNSYDLPRLTLRDMLGPLFRHRLVVFGTFSLVLAASILVAFFWAKHYYAATMQIVVARERSNPPVTGQQSAAADNTTSVTADEVASEVALLQGRDMLQEVVRSCQLTKRRSFLSQLLNNSTGQESGADAARDVEVATNVLAGALRVEPQRTSHIINVKYGRLGAPEIPACVLQTLGKLYLDKHLRLQRPAGAFDFFAQQTGKYQQALADSEIQLVEFTQSAGVAAPEIVRASMAQQLVVAEANLYESRQRLAASRQRIESLDQQMNATPSRSSTAETSLSANILLEQLQSSLLTSQLKKTQLLLKYDPSYPLVKEADDEIAQTKKAIEEAERARYVNTTTDRDATFEYLRQDRAKTEADIAEDQAKTVAVGRSIGDIKLQLVDLDAKALKQAALQREYKANEENYLLYMTKREQERTADALDARRIANVAIAVPAYVPVLPAHSPSSVLFAGFWLSLFCGISVGFIAEFADPSLRTPSEVEKLLDVTVLAALPKQIGSSR